MKWQEENKLNIPGIFNPDYHRIQILYSTPEAYTHAKYREIQQERQ